MDKLTLGLNLTALGIGVVFIVLILLRLVMEAERLAVKRLLQTKEPEPKTAPSNNKTGDLPPKTKQPTVPVTEENLSPQKIAAIAACIAMTIGPGQNIRLTSIRRLEKDPGNLWSQTGRSQIINNRINFTNKGGQH
jgi:sodium pump decarboxylase gamma subunit